MKLRQLSWQLGAGRLLMIFKDACMPSLLNQFQLNEQLNESLYPLEHAR